MHAGKLNVRSTERSFPPKYDENTFQAIQSTALEMHSRRPYKIFICSVILGEMKLQGLQYYVSEKFRCNVKFYESENFSDSSLHHILESENFRFLLSKKNSVTWVVKCKKNRKKIKLQKIVGNLFEKLRKLYMNGTSIQKFLAVLKQTKILGNICFSEQIFYGKQSLGAPEM